MSGRAEVFNAPIDVILTNHDVTQPDIVVVADRRSVTHRGIEAPPLLVVEVLSPSTEKFDRQVKARRFAALGVPHYWVLDPEARRVECYRNVSSTFALTSSADGDRSPASPDFEGLTIHLAAIWRQAAAGASGPGQQACCLQANGYSDPGRRVGARCARARVFAPPRAARRGGGREVASVFAPGLKIRRSTPRNQPVQRSNGPSPIGAAGQRLRPRRFLQRRSPEVSAESATPTHSRRQFVRQSPYFIVAPRSHVS
jgi:hypothetical protein